METMNSKQLVQKYNVPCPRYTSYPTVPSWNTAAFKKVQWEYEVRSNFAHANKNGGISLYIHLPFCESLCTYCGCNTRITVNHAVEMPYIKAVLKEWKLYLNLFKEKPVLTELHLGGGTPTFFNPKNLEFLIRSIIWDCIIPEHTSYSFEGHPNNTTEGHLKVLYELGFRRVSFGIQDFERRVQEIINRVQPIENVIRVTEQARTIGYTSVNYDLVYGLPLQTIESITTTIEKVIELKPDRIAFYSYAHVPWLKPGQRKYTEADLPADAYKRELYTTGQAMFERAGYEDIGMDHFALPDDELTLAAKTGKLHRNFMGYTALHTAFSIGLGVSAISDTWGAFAQNVKTVEDYQKLIAQDIIPIFKGHLLTAEDLKIRTHILSVMCEYKTQWKKGELSDNILVRLKDLEADGLIQLKENSLAVTLVGMGFLRNICMAFDLRYWSDQVAKVQFSKAV